MIGEVAQAHDGSLGAAHAYIDAIADAGADAVKFQTHVAAAESTAREPWRRRFSRQDATRFDYWRRMEFAAEQWCGLRDHTVERGLFFLSSAFSPEAADLLERLEVPAWKIASGETSTTPLLERLVATGKPILLSTGMSPWTEIDNAVAAIRKGRQPFVVLQCTSLYPTPLEKVGLNLLDEIKVRYDCPVGLSDHSGTIWPGVLAAALGARVIEVHVSLSREAFSPDQEVSLTTAELRHLIAGTRAAAALRTPVDKDALAEELKPMRAVFGKSVVAARRLAAGQLLEAEDLALKKPGDGLTAANLPRLLGRRLVRDLERDQLVGWEDLA